MDQRPLERTADVVVIGSGIQGASVAYHLAQSGVRDVVVVESYKKGGGSTEASAAMVMHQTGVEATSHLAKLSIAKYDQFQSELGIDVGYRVSGSIVFATTPAGAEDLQRRVAMQNRLGIPSELLSAEQIAARAGHLIRAEGILGGSACDADGYVDAKRVVDAYLDRAGELGASLHQFTPATAILTDRERVVGIRVGDGHSISTPIVVNCAGAWARDVGRMAGVSLPIRNNKRNIVVVAARNTEAYPIMEHSEGEWYFKPHFNQVLIGIGPTRWVDDADRIYPADFDHVAIQQTNSYLIARAPSLYPARVLDRWAGYRPMIDPTLRTVDNPDRPDELPILGPVPGLLGYYNCCAWGAFGVTLGPIGGEILARLVVGEPPPIDLDKFTANRFAGRTHD